MTGQPNAVLADRARAETWVALSTSTSLDAARRVLLHGGDPDVRATALKMLDRLAAQQDHDTTTEGSAAL